MSARSYARDTMETLLIRSRTFAEHRCFDLHVSPLPCRRTTSIIGDFLPLTPLRSKSALIGPHAAAVASGGNYVMARNHVSVARFCDWSEDRHAPTNVSVSHLYREIAAAGGGQLSRAEIGQLKKADGLGTPRSKNNARLSPGRMFLREKGMLTKGEREIIEGIYKNRGDLQQREGSRSDMNVRRHHEAWLVGKAANKAGTEGGSDMHQRGALLEVTSAGEAPRLTGADVTGVSNGCSSGGEAGAGAGRGPSHRGQCLLCLQEQQMLQQLSGHRKPPRFHPSLWYGQSSRHFVAKETAGWQAYDGASMTPPTTPEPGCSPTNITPQRINSNCHPQSVVPFHSYTTTTRLLSRRQEPGSYGAVLPGLTTHSPLQDQRFSEEMESSDSESQDSRGKKRVEVKVYLPKVGADAADEDIKACMLQGRPVLAREKHISQRDFRQKLHKDDNNAETIHLLGT